jgi:hypothetical protein
MKSSLVKTLLLFSLFFLTFDYARSSVYAKNENESSIHELPRADQCDIITITIRELAFSRKQLVKKILSLEKPAGSASENNEDYGQQMNEYQEMMKSLQEQIDTKEQQLENCLQQKIISPKAKESETAQKKRESE